MITRVFVGEFGTLQSDFRINILHYEQHFTIKSCSLTY